MASQFQKWMFDKAAGDILIREGMRLCDAARAEFAEWQKDVGFQTELRVLKKMLTARGTTGRALDSAIKGFSDAPNPLSAYLAEHPCPPGMVARFLNEVRADYERLQSLTEEGDDV